MNSQHWLSVACNDLIRYIATIWKGNQNQLTSDTNHISFLRMAYEHRPTRWMSSHEHETKKFDD
jgi:hypothetical protein